MAAEEVLKGQLDCDEVSPRNRFRRVGSRVRVTDVCGTPGGWLSLSKMLSGANAFEISDIERMKIGAHQAGVTCPVVTRKYQFARDKRAGLTRLSHC